LPIGTVQQQDRRDRRRTEETKRPETKSRKRNRKTTGRRSARPVKQLLLGGKRMHH
jgi:hypothetical protein